jgi:hypothetical protein
MVFVGLLEANTARREVRSGLDQHNILQKTATRRGPPVEVDTERER